MLKYLRIAVTALSLILCAAFVALWVRSYRYWDQFGGWLPVVHAVIFDSRQGDMRVVFVLPNSGPKPRWGISTFPAEKAADWANLLKDSVVRFRYTNPGPGDYGVILPHWFPVFLFVTFAATPWITWRFSLRTLLIATTLVAVALGTVIYMAR